MHNFDDETCVKVLQSQIPAMSPNSVIVVDDRVLPDAKPPPGMPGVEYTAALSLAVEAMFSALDRRKAHWRQLLASASLEIRKIFKFTKFNQAVVIAIKHQ